MDARKLAVILAVMVGVAILAGPGAAVWAQDPGGGDKAAGDARPAATALRLGEADVLAAFTAEVRTRPQLRDRALASWRTHFAAQADAVRTRFAREADWRPALADAAALVDDFLEASLLPRARPVRADAHHVWVEKLDPATGQRTQVLQAAPVQRLILAPHKAEPKAAQPDDGSKVDGALKPAR